MKQQKRFVGLDFDNWYFLGQDQTVSFFKDSLKKENLFQTCLFCGPESIGKKALALRLVMAATCQEEKSPCFECDSCLRINEQESENLIIFDQKKISIKEIRQLKRKLSLKQDRRLFCLIDGYESLSMEAEHALLKILEEPNKNNHFIILAKNRSTILKTVLSRSLVFYFNCLSNKVIEKYLDLNKIEYDQELIDFIQGRPGLAMEYVSNKNILKDYDSRKELLETVLESNFHEKFMMVKKIVEKENVEALLSDWISLFRAALCDNYQQEKSSIQKKYSVTRISRIIKNLEASKSLLEKNVNRKLILENIFLNI